MLPEIEKIMGVPPGAVLRWELKKRDIGTSVFAKEIGEYPGIITDVTKLRRGITPKLSIKLGQKLGVEDDYFLLLQAYYQIDKLKKEEILTFQETPDLTILRRQIFWESNFDNIDFQRYKGYVVKRIFERGSEAEILEIIRFYGEEECGKIIREARSLLFTAAENAVKYLNMNRYEIRCLKNYIGKQYRKPWLRS